VSQSGLFLQVRELIHHLEIHLDVPPFPVNTHNSIGWQSNLDGHDSKLITFTVMANKNDRPLRPCCISWVSTTTLAGIRALPGRFLIRADSFPKEKGKKGRKRNQTCLWLLLIFLYLLFEQRRIVVGRGKDRTNILQGNLQGGIQGQVYPTMASPQRGEAMVGHEA
jgi:hypothetical protein